MTSKPLGIQFPSFRADRVQELQAGQETRDRCIRVDLPGREQEQPQREVRCEVRGDQH